MKERTAKWMAQRAAEYIVAQRELARKIKDEIDTLAPLIESDIEIDVKVVRLRSALMDITGKISIALYDLSMMTELMGVPVSDFLKEEEEDG